MSAVASILIHQCDIYRRAAGTADFGNPSGSYALHLSAVACRRHERSAKLMEYPSEVVETNDVFFFLHGTGVAMKDQIRFGGETFDINNPVDDVAGAGELMRVMATRSKVD